LQLDTKIAGIPASVLADALRQAREARLDILDVMAEAIMEPRADVRDTAPKIATFEIPVEKIGEVIGPKGKVINAIQAETGADISVDDDGAVGIVAIASTDRGAVLEAERQIKLILDPPTADVGATYRGRVVNITKFGAFVNILPGRDGLVHISKLGGGRRIDRVEDVLELGEEIEVIVEDVDPNGKISLIPKRDDSDAGGPPFARRRETSRAGDGPGRDPGRSDRDGGFGRHRDGGRLAPRRSEAGRADHAGGEQRRDDRSGTRSRPPAPASSARGVSFEDSFDLELEREFGELGPDPRLRRGGRRGGRGPR
ncbi:MAG: S1 RNA-binding domain-containing protein, partial [Acidimicrobiaceae bacterium]|nr:S1 RNA-binding domain-containing protein [Acidimicrobiaceae bacterium]